MVAKCASDGEDRRFGAVWRMEEEEWRSVVERECGWRHFRPEEFDRLVWPRIGESEWEDNGLTGWRVIKI